MTQPLFVLGKQRSGTTWLANQLSQHSQIAAVRHDHHGGVHESAYFSHVAGRYGDLSRKTNYVEFVEAMVVSDTMQILDVDKAFLYSLWPTTYEAVFQTVMARQAQKKRAKYWLDKTPGHTLMIDELAALYPDASFVAIVRNARDVMRSNMGRYNGRPWQRRRALVRGGLNLTHHNKEIIRFADRSERIHVLSYEALKQDAEAVLSKVCTFLELDFEPDLLKKTYQPNTTFREERRRGKALSKGDERLLDFTMLLGGYIPLSGFRATRSLTTRDTKKPLPEWFFSMYPPVFEKQYQRDT